MKYLNLGTKIIGMTLILLVLMLISGLFSIVKMGLIRTELREIAKEHMPLTQVVTEVTIGQLDQAHWFERALRYALMVRNGDESAKAHIETAIAEFGKHTARIREILNTADAEENREENRDPGTEAEEIRERLRRISKGHTAYVQHVSNVFELIRQGQMAEAERLAREIETEEDVLNLEVETFLKHMGNLSGKSLHRAEQNEGAAFKGMIGISVFSVLFGLLSSVLITRRLTRSLDRVIRGLADGSVQVVSAAGETANASQALSEGASQQAAAIQETSSSLEELSAMTRQNADHAAQAKSSQDEAYKSLETANLGMKETHEAMSRIRDRGEEIGKIIKSIDEIAFQTNLLALNAAVEAARAGEAGAGFAVVADEVRNLALRAADASGNTQGLIEKTVNEISSGSEQVEKTRQSFDLTMTHNKKVTELIDEIASASAEQAQGIEQISKAVGEMETVTHQNAANAEQSAAAAEELNAQAEQLKAFADELLCAGQGVCEPDEQTLLGTATDNFRPRLSTERPSPPVREIATERKVSPEQLIPLDDEDFKDF